MIKLFGKTDTNFASNGDLVIRPLKAKVHKQDNGDYYLNLEVGLEYADFITEGRIVVADTPQGSQAFRINNATKNKTKIVVKAPHVFYDSKNILISDSFVMNLAGNDAINHLNDSTMPTSPFVVSSDISTINSYRAVRKSLYEALNEFIRLWGGHLVRDNFNIEINEDIGRDNGVIIQYKKNLKDITFQEKWDDVVTQLLPVGKDGILLNALSPSVSIYVYSDIQYVLPYTKTITFNQEHILEDDYKDASGNLNEQAYKQALVNDLYAQAIAYVNKKCIPQINYTLKANVDKLTDIGDIIEVKDERLGVDVLTSVVSFDYDCLLEKYTEIQFGNFKNTLENLIPSITSSIDNSLELKVQNISDFVNQTIANAIGSIWNTIDKYGNSYTDSNMYNIVSNYGTYPRLMKYNANKTYVWLDDRYRIITDGVMGNGSYFALRAKESVGDITITEIANAFGIMSPENDGRTIVFYRCHGTRTISVDGTSYTIPYYSIRAKASNTSGTFNTNVVGTILWSTMDDESSFYMQNDKLMVDYVLSGGTISVWEPFAITESGYCFFSRIKHNDLQRTYEYHIDGVYSDKCQDIGKVPFSISNGVISRTGNPELVIRGQIQVDMDGNVNPKTRVGMVSFAKIKGSTKFVGCVESSVNQTARVKRNMNVQLFECNDISQQYISPTTPHSILLPEENQSRGAPFITTLDDGRMAIMFMSSQEFKGTKRTDTNENNRIEMVYVTKIPITEGMVETIGDDMFTKVDFFDFGNSQYGKWGAIQNIDGTLYKAFTYGINTSATESTRYGNVIIYSK